MKVFNFYRLFTTVLVVISTMTSNLFSQTDSIVTLPLFPNDSEETKLICYMKLNSSPCYLDSSMVDLVNDTIHVKLFYAMGSMSSICERVDTLNLGVLNVGSYTIQTEKYHVQINDTLLYNTIYLSVNIGHLSIEDVFSSNSINLYPNPTNKFLNINVNGMNDLQAIKIYDISGRLVLSKDLDNVNEKYIELDISSLVNGLYTCTLIGKRNPISKKFIKR